MAPGAGAQARLIGDAPAFAVIDRWLSPRRHRSGPALSQRRRCAYTCASPSRSRWCKP
ncbi:hypothetical protein [Lysobacter gummosus]|uniref:hypothetical protein n=1 Tax=Lysobacter gummosus TaxID=262324 RepID=UPI0036299FF5